jgi:hypothetical protein
MPQNMKRRVEAVKQWKSEGKVTSDIAAELESAFEKMDSLLDKPRWVYSNQQAAKDLRTIRDFILEHSGRGIDTQLAEHVAASLEYSARDYEGSLPGSRGDKPSPG